jgi:hypothetical protein
LQQNQSSSPVYNKRLFANIGLEFSVRINTLRFARLGLHSRCFFCSFFSIFICTGFQSLLLFLIPDINREFPGTDFINAQYAINMGAQQINGLIPGLNQLIAETPGQIYPRSSLLILIL